MQRLMIVDDSSVIRKVAKRILSGLDFLVSEADSASQAQSHCHAQLPHILIVDATMPDALEFISTIRSMPNGESVRIYYCLVEADLKSMMQGKRAGADDFLIKPFDRKILTSVFGRFARVVA
ncbi:response regulator [Pararhizobium haloflavum]|uniref:response regulator n=1 Tax=Pararhizobium haloflavum TaxID=2037914 RepID=UPI000C1A53BD|nr:response regulator [Pararhizobium haloflavum]